MSDYFYKELRRNVEADLAKQQHLLEEIFAPMQKTMESLQRLLNTAPFVELQKQMTQLQESVEKLQQKTKFYENLKQEGWFIAPALLDLPHYVTDALESKTGQELSECFCNILRKDHFALLNAMIEIWELIPEYQKRKSIIDAGVQAHKEAKYELSVPVFGLLIEGILKDIIGVAKFNARNHIRKHFTKKLTPRLTNYDKFTQKEKIFSDLLAKEIFAGNKKWSRNEIAHNYLPEHAIEENSVRSLFLLDKILRDWGDISENNPATQEHQSRQKII